MLEVEMKFRLVDPNSFVHRMQEKFQAVFDAGIVERDLYFQHPSRNLAQTDEAFRLRREGDSLLVTYKGPKQDKLTKQREEIELPLLLPSETTPIEERMASWQTLLNRLSFREVAEVVKFRRSARFNYQGFPVMVTWDHLDELGDFAEIETLSPPPADLAKVVVMSLAATLNLSTIVPTSYLSLLLQKREKA